MQSRRIRDVVIVFFSLIGGMCYFINIGIQSFIQTNLDRMSEEQAAELAAFQPLIILQWLPPGAAARAIERSLAADWLAAGGWLLYSFVFLLALTWVWYKLLIRLTTGEGYLISARPREEARQKVQREERRERNWLGWLPADMAQITSKEFKSIWRIPQRRVGIFQGVLMPVFFLGAFFFSDGFGETSYPAWVGLILPAYALFLFWANTQNMLAWEGTGLPTLLLTPIPRERIFRAKAVALFVITAVPILLFGLIMLGSNRSWVSGAGILTAVMMGGPAMAATAVGSVLFPIPVQVESRQNRGLFKSGGDTKTGCAYISIIPIGLGLVTVPTALPLLAAYFLELPWLAVPGLLISAAYAIAVFWFGTRWAGQLMANREPELAARLKLPEDEN
ncbi:MAG: hypothetical protein GY796_04715 [Chloroflexi bacterium]|nr:hypothetical protein [Chloroflexota bacterium]